MPYIINNQKGVIIIYALIIAGAVLIINFSLMAIFLPKLKVSRYPADTVAAIYTADSVMEWCLYEARMDQDVPQPIMANGAIWQVRDNKPGKGVFYDSDGSGSGNHDLCKGEDLGFISRGVYNGVARAFEVNEP